jgi:ribosomal-protein-alanine N-acetyltransferase
MKNPDEFPEISTERLTLREITEDDADWYLHHFSIPEIVETTGFDGPKDREAAREQLEKFILGPFRESTGLRWGITLKGSDELIGSCGFFKWEHDPHRRAEIGYDLDPAFWRQGIMKEALTAIMDYGFENMELNRITLLAFSFNEGSIGLARFFDDEYFAILRSDWDRIRASI